MRGSRCCRLTPSKALAKRQAPGVTANRKRSRLRTIWLEHGPCVDRVVVRAYHPAQGAWLINPRGA
jgi:hypothetical protein